MGLGAREVWVLGAREVWVLGARWVWVLGGNVGVGAGGAREV